MSNEKLHSEMITLSLPGIVAIRFLALLATIVIIIVINHVKLPPQKILENENLKRNNKKEK
jgi:hypothetical protein